MIKNWGAVCALSALLSLPIVGFLFFDGPHCYNDDTACRSQYNQRTVNNDRTSVFVPIRDWAAANRDAIDALAAIGSVTFALALVIFTAILATKTSGLYSETAALRAIADQQATDMKESIAVANRSALAAERAAKVAEDSVVAVETPFLHPVIVGHQFKATWDGFVGSVGLGQAVQFRFRNIGRTPAILMDYYTCPIFSLGVPPPMDDLLALHTGGLSTQVIAANAVSTELSFNLNEGLYQSLFEGKFGRQGNNMLFFVGQSRYIDLFGNEFIGGFCFAYAAARNEWYGFGGAGLQLSPQS
jgi:hypothetical protein